MKATNIQVTQEFLLTRTAKAVAGGYAKQKWIFFCEVMLEREFRVSLYEARRTFSKYLTVTQAGRAGTFKVRFSNHKPIASREAAGDCDFFVGVSNQTVTTTEQAIQAVLHFFSAQPERPVKASKPLQKRVKVAKPPGKLEKRVSCISCRKKLAGSGSLKQHWEDVHA